MTENGELRAFYDSYIVLPHLNTVISDLDWLRLRGRSGGSVPSMIIMGDSGSGKSALLDYYINTHLRNGSRQVLLTRVRPTLLETLKWMNYELGRKNSRAKPCDYGLTDSVIRLLKQSDVELIIIDECQELIQSRRQKERQDVNDRLKFISESTKKPIVWVGLPCSKHLLSDGQWESRAKVVYQLPYFKLSHEASRDSFVKLLDLFDKILPIPSFETLSSPQVGFPLFAASRGEMRALKELIGAALSEALSEGSSSLRLEHFAVAWERFNRQRSVSDENPFEVDMVDDLKVSEIEAHTDFELDSETDTLVQTERIFSDATSLAKLLTKS
ncbi:TniB family NTP-binding protein [Vibrio sp. 10N.222.51.C8]|uniref:TniB family NTP-binding protein n=2 Tax=Vibrio TaxID=662 RepID=UPI0010BD28D1|nr:TniB family NTP-binding protein [Vibrio sp. F13]TKF39667.1 DUF2075 domain-containing protein [Vibrio sp. F13]TKF72337.1 DUF2075 domain-containing protein [Vibrio sp. F13]